MARSRPIGGLAVGLCKCFSDDCEIIPSWTCRDDQAIRHSRNYCAVSSRSEERVVMDAFNQSSTPRIIYPWKADNDADLLISREWLVTNGLGGYAWAPCEGWRRGDITACSCPIFLLRAGAR